MLHPSGASIASFCCSQNCLEQVLNIMRSIMARKVSHKDVANKIVPDDFVKPVTFGFGNQHSRKHVPDVFYLLRPCSRIQLHPKGIAKLRAHISQKMKKEYLFVHLASIPKLPGNAGFRVVWVSMKFSHIIRTGILFMIRITRH